MLDINSENPLERELLKIDMFKNYFEHEFDSRIGNLRENWRIKIGVDMDALVYPTLFRLLSSYLDQGIALWKFPIRDLNFLEALRHIESNGWVSIFRRKRARKIFQEQNHTIESLLEILVGENKDLYEQYIFDQQFEHQGWSGFVSELERVPTMLLDQRKIKTSEFIFLELLMEIDALDYKLGEGKWKPLEFYLDYQPKPLFAEVRETRVFTLAKIWQEAYEWSYYMPVLKGIIDNRNCVEFSQKDFQTIMCIDDRICSWRRHVEDLAPNCETFGTPGFFGLDMYFQPEGGKFYTKVCPMPMTPIYLVKEVPKGHIFSTMRKLIKARKANKTHHHDTDIHFSEHAHNSLFGWLISQFIGFFSALNLVSAVLFPKRSAATSSPFNHMEKNFPLTIENHGEEMENGLHLGFTKVEMAERVSNMLHSIGLMDNFAPIVYVIGHGSTSTNNPYYAGYDCGACSGRAGSVNARAFCLMANDYKVRELLIEKGIIIPETTFFMGGLHDTTQDVVQFFDKDIVMEETKRAKHLEYKKLMREALLRNAVERSRNFENVNKKQTPIQIHKEIKKRAVSFFEPRPEYNHATNALCIIGRRQMTKGLFLDRRAFLNSYDYRIDKDGKYLQGIVNAAAPVCGGINLEYYFSRTDNQKLGSGSKLPHNVMGLIGVANGIEGDLRPGLPSQMVEIHEPVRLMMIVEQFPDIIIDAIQANAATYEWFINEWIHLICYHPINHMMMKFQNGEFKEIQISKEMTPKMSSSQLLEAFMNQSEQLPVTLIQQPIT